jgi:hypothetical protein
MMNKQLTNNFSKGIYIFLAGLCASLLLGLVLLPPVEMESGLKFVASMLPAGAAFFVLLYLLTTDDKENRQ